ncbi:hypothetical protein P168DRAFT_327125 [Aspergillus campestris IBT 28561]|uniref:Uncharacterized protein n=1 Tax=Aspergillus campestris (strain IBT 28561) TaxID=1392248 RepID=A0A2I1D2N8_ASPC2|nr:uncharacterized protein P168DRAFT_327125 [Aspergillus campestris IBT 28561]PKY04142.1 hypothetical protein P168DRAFT_327125 [Aspergillus campestris IBT 28561]
MASPSAELENSPNPRTREENQERAFIAASRRKDRSLDARLESANRASVLHKQRTGKSLNINRDIVEREAMYEEVDERYQEKLQNIINNQRYQLVQDEFRNNLYNAFALRNATAGGLQHRRAASHTPRGSINGIHKMSLDLSHLRSSISEGMHSHHTPIDSPIGTAGPASASNYVLSPTYSSSTHPHPHPHPHPHHHPHQQSPSSYPAYMGPAITPSTPAWPQNNPWPAGFQTQHTPTPFDPATMGVATDMTMGTGMPVTTRQYRDRMASAPVIPVHGLPTGTPARSASNAQHTRVRSEPTNAAAAAAAAHHHHQQMQQQQFHQMQQSLALGRSPHIDMDMDAATAPSSMSTTEPIPTPDLCPTPSTPHSPTTTTATAAVSAYHDDASAGAMFSSALNMLNKEDDSGGGGGGGHPGNNTGTATNNGVSFSNDLFDADYAEFSQFAFALGGDEVSGLIPEAGAGPEWKFDELVALDEYPVSA